MQNGYFGFFIPLKSLFLSQRVIPYTIFRVFIVELPEIWSYQVRILTVDAAVHAENLAYNNSSLAPFFDFEDQNLSLCV